MSIVPDIDFSSLGNLGKVYDDAKRKAQRDQILAQAPTDGSLQSLGSLGAKLIQAGDTESGIALARLADSASRDTRDFALRKEEIARAQANADRGFGFQEKQASPEYIGGIARTKAQVDQEFAPKTTNLKTTAGDEITVEKGPNGFRVPQIEGMQGAPNNPFAQGKMNEAQSKDALYTNRMLGAEKVLRSLDADVGTTMWGRLQDKASNATGFNMRSPELQKFDQAQRDFINATLRRESGAAIAQSEFDNANKQYFPQPGDTPDVITQKRANRMEAIKGIGAGAGPGFKPAMSFDDKGDLIPNPGLQPAPPPGAVPGTPPAPQPNAWRTKENIIAARQNPQVTISQARAAMEKGMPPQEAARRLQEAGIDPRMLTAQPGFASPEQRQ